jgi:MFS family permease
VLGLLAGPAVGGLLLGTLGPIDGIFVNALIYLPLTLWLMRAPYGPKFRTGADAHATRVAARPQSWRDIAATIRDVATNRTILCMTLLAGGFSFFVGNSYQAQMPGFAQDLGHGASSLFYSILMAAPAAGALTAGIVLESGGFLTAKPRTAFFLVMSWCVTVTVFAMCENYWMALAVLFAVGFLDLSFNSMAQTLVQLEAPAHLRGRVIGLYNTSSAGMRAFAGITVGWGGELVGIHWSLAASAMTLFAGTGILFVFLMRAAHLSARASPGE